MKCGRCGQENQEAAKFCMACGGPLGGGATDVERSEALVREANLLRLRGDLEGATARAQQALQASASNAWAHELLGELYEKQRNRDLALHHYEQALAYRPGLTKSRERVAALKPRSPQPPPAPPAPAVALPAPDPPPASPAAEAAVVTQCREALRAAFSAKEKAERLSLGLDQLVAAGEATEEQRKRLGQEYEARFSEAAQRVGGVKEEIGAKAAALRAEQEQRGVEMRQAQEEVTAGGPGVAAVEARLGLLKARHDQGARLLASLQELLKVESAAEVGGAVEVPAAPQPFVVETKPGAALTSPVAVAGPPVVQPYALPVGAVAPAGAPGASLMTAKRFSPALFALVLICFFLPFASISCQDQKIGTVSGFQMVTGGALKTDLPDFGGGRDEGGDLKPQPLAILALLAAVAGLALSFRRPLKSALLPTILGGAGLVLLLLLMSKFNSDIAKEGEGVLRVNWESGLWLALFSFAASGGVNAFLFSQWRKEPLFVPAQGPAGVGVAPAQGVRTARAPIRIPAWVWAVAVAAVVLAGAAYAGYYFLTHRPQLTVEVRPVTEEVAGGWFSGPRVRAALEVQVTNRGGRELRVNQGGSLKEVDKALASLEEALGGGKQKRAADFSQDATYVVAVDVHDPERNAWDSVGSMSWSRESHDLGPGGHATFHIQVFEGKREEWDKLKWDQVRVVVQNQARWDRVEKIISRSEFKMPAVPPPAPPPAAVPAQPVPPVEPEVLPGLDDETTPAVPSADQPATPAPAPAPASPQPRRRASRSSGRGW